MSAWHEKARELLRSGMTQKQIAAELGVSQPAVCYAVSDARRDKVKRYDREKYRSDAEYRQRKIDRAKTAYARSRSTQEAAA